jgi:hypothetical protein
MKSFADDSGEAFALSLSQRERVPERSEGG